MRRFILFCLVVSLAASLFAATLWLAKSLWDEYGATPPAETSGQHSPPPDAPSAASATTPPPASTPDETGEDPAILLTLRRWAYCRARFTDETAARTCARELAQKDFLCLKQPTPTAQHDCVSRLYP
jgi:hypothetical protein